MAENYIPHTGPLVTKAEAKAMGLNRYFTGVPCHRGHVAQRTISGYCAPCRQAYDAQYAKVNAEGLLVKKRVWNATNPEKRSEYSLRWQRANLDAMAVMSRNYRARVIDAEGCHTKSDIESLFSAQKGKCAYCRCKLGKKFHVDHIKPISKGGSNWPSNLQLTCQPCNSKKSAKMPEEFARSIGLLV